MTSQGRIGMQRTQFRQTLLIAGAASLLGLMISSSPMLVLAQGKFTPPKVGLPGRRVGGGTRGSEVCMTNKKFLTALMPATNLGLTFSENPQLFWYVPEISATSNPKAIFVLLDEQNRELYQTEVKLTGKPGIVSLKLPQTGAAPTLAIGKRYLWQFAVVCNGKEQDYVEGWLQRIEPNAELTNQLQKASVRDRPSLYAGAGIWQETLSSLAELRRANPKDLKLNADWASLLKSVKLESVASEPLLPCCTQADLSKVNPSKGNNSQSQKPTPRKPN